MDPPQPSAQACPQAMEQQVDVIVVHAHCGPVHALHYLPVNSPGFYAQILPDLLALGRSAADELYWALLLSELCHYGIGQVNLSGYTILLHQSCQFGLVLDLIGWCFALGHQLEGVGHIPSMVRVCRGPGGNGSQKVTGNDDVCSCTTYAFCSRLAEGIDATWAHVAVATAQAKFSEAALGLLLVETIPRRLKARLGCYSQHLLACRVYGSIFDVLDHE